MRNVLLFLSLLVIVYWLTRNPEQPEPVVVEDEDYDIPEDVYLIGLMTEAGEVDLEGKFPWLGSFWGPYRGDDDG